MSDNVTTPELPHQLVLPYPFAVVDALCRLFLHDYAQGVRYTGLKIKRESLDSGSAHYVLSTELVIGGAVLRERRDTGVIAIRAVSVDEKTGVGRTYITARPVVNKGDTRHEQLRQEDEGGEFMREVLVYLVQEIIEEEEANEQLYQTSLAFLGQIKAGFSVPNPFERLEKPEDIRSRGRKPKEVNDEARRRVAAGEDKQAVFTDWLRARELNADDAQVRADNWDAFRKALSRTKNGRT